MNFVQASLRYRSVTLTILLLVFLTGIYSLITMPRREDPRITIPAGLVLAYYPGATAAEIEEQVTKPLEEYLFRFNEVLKSKTHSNTRDGMVIISVWLNEDIHQPDIFWNKLRHQFMITKSLSLPEGVIGPVVDSDFGDTEAMLISLSGNQVEYSELSEYVRKLEEQLRQVKSTAKIKRYGIQKEQLTVSFNPDKLAQLGLSLHQVIQVVQSQNKISPSGGIEIDAHTISFYTSILQSRLDLENLIVGTSKSGNVVRLKDVTSIQQEYADPSAHIRVNGEKSLLVSVQMNAGNNIVWFGQDIQSTLQEFEKTLPSNIQLTTIVDQPRLVDQNISSFLEEFLFAIISVIIVIMLLLPMRVAAVAAAAIPMTIAVTFTFMHLFSIELHQVSLATLIVVLGMVVDDAIVVADNYVELLDRGVDRWNAAWRSAYDLIVPILTATITIIAAFLPIVILKGPIGEFIHDLPITVTIALTSSFLVAMLLTPMLCFFFIRKGLHDKASANSIRKRFSLLDLMQKAYDKTIDWASGHRTITITLSLMTIVLAVWLMKSGIKKQFMPFAERDQFVIELWMPTGTSLEKTDASITRLADSFKEDKRVKSMAVFSGMSAPRVYYNFSPETPISNYAQILVNTLDNESTTELATELSTKLSYVVPEGTVQVKLMQQGQPMTSPLEFRIYGDDVTRLRSIAADIKSILQQTPGSAFITDDFKEDFYGVKIQLKEEASRLGFTSSMVAQTVHAAFKGYTVSRMFQGDQSLDIVFRMEESGRNNTQELENLYVQSAITGASVPLRQIADLVPVWQPGRINHRNGIRCLSVRADASPGRLPSEILADVRPLIDSLPLPPEYSIEYGGEKANQEEVVSRLAIALGISLIIIFFVLLFQFKNLKEPLLVMISIPLSLFGAAFGLWVTNNTLGFTAFVGLISLSGIVVRNAIILIDHTKELLAKGLDVRRAAIEAGKRRLRPIFLTAMAAAVGVVPMILSGSSLWSPLASVIAFGVTWSMLISLIAIPVMYIVFIQPDKKEELDAEPSSTGSLSGAMAMLVLLVVSSISGFAQSTEPVKLSLQEASQMALQNNHLLKVKELQIREKEQKVKEDKVNFFPVLNLNGNYQYNSGISELIIEQGSFGTLNLGSLAIPMPAANDTFEMGEHDTYNASVVLYQPLTQLPKINAGAKVSGMDAAISRVEKQQAENQILQAVEKLYYGILIAQKQTEEVEARLELARLKVYDAESAVQAGKARLQDLSGLQAALAGEEQALLVVQMQQEDYEASLKQVLDLDDAQQLELLPVEDIKADSLFLQEIAAEQAVSIQANRELQLAGLSQQKAAYALKAGQFSLLPELGVMAGYSYQKGNLIFPENNSFVGLTFKWNIQGVASTRHLINQRKLIWQQAGEKLADTRSRIEKEEANLLRKVRQSSRLVQVAEKARYYRELDYQTKLDKFQSGLALESEVLEALALLRKSEADAFAAQLNFRLAVSDLAVLRGQVLNSAIL